MEYCDGIIGFYDGIGVILVGIWLLLLKVWYSDCIMWKEQQNNFDGIMGYDDRKEGYCDWIEI